jgi:hypothetical protein
VIVNNDRLGSILVSSLDILHKSFVLSEEHLNRYLQISVDSELKQLKTSYKI